MLVVMMEENTKTQNEKKTKRATFRRPMVGVIGASSVDSAVMNMAFDVGRNIAKKGWHLLTGGGNGVMSAACKGFLESRTIPQIVSIGILPSDDSKFANPYLDIPIPTGMGWARNTLITRAANALIAIGGCSGTLSEIAFAWQMDRPIVALSSSGGWAEKLAGRAVDNRRDDIIQSAASADQAVLLISESLSAYNEAEN